MTRLLLKNRNNDDELEQYYQKEIQDITESQKNLLDYINFQNNKIDNIENNINNIHNNTELGMKNLAEASNYNLSYTGILFGGIVGGLFVSPLGFLFGMKAGTIISLSGLCIGSVTSYKLQNIDISN